VNNPPKPRHQFRGRLGRTAFFFLMFFALIPVLVTLGITYLQPGLIFWFLGILSVLIFCTAWIGSRWLARPLVGLSEKMHKFAEGEWQQRAIINRDDEIGALADAFNQMANELSSLHIDLESKVISRTKQVRAASEVTQFSITTSNLSDLLKRLVDLLVERFGYYCVSIFLVDETGSSVFLNEYRMMNREEIFPRGLRLEIGSKSMIGWVTANNKSHITSDVATDPLYLNTDKLPDTRSEAVIPISIGERVLGALDVQSAEVNAFSADDVSMLQTMANQVAAAIQNIRLLEATQINLEETTLLYTTSRQIGQAGTEADIFQAIVNALSKTTYISIIYAINESSSHLVAIHNAPDNLTESMAEEAKFKVDDLELLLPSERSYLIADWRHSYDMPPGITKILESWKNPMVAFIPIRRETTILALIILGTINEIPLTPTAIQPYANLAELATTAFEKVYAQQTTEKRLSELQTLNSFSEAVSIQTNLHALYQVIQRTLTSVFGGIYFIIANFDSTNEIVEIPYVFDGTQENRLPSFPLGNDLTSFVIRNHQPILLNSINEANLGELKISNIDNNVKSCLGIPLTVGGEVIGAIIVQDHEHEQRFTEDDQRLLNTMSTQIAAAIRNTRLLDSTRRQVEREHFLFDVTRKIRSSADMKQILATTATELGRIMGARRARIDIGVGKPDRPGNPRNE